MNKERKLIIAGNWKMNKTVAEALTLVDDLKRELGGVKEVDLVVCPPFTALESVSRAVLDSNLRLGAQNMSEHNVGAYTGEIAAVMLKEFSTRYVILGHSERRQYYRETDALVARKAAAAHTANLKPIICIGETLAEREAGRTEQILATQVTGSLAGLAGEQMLETTLAYEPVWAIGTGLTPSTDDVAEVHAAIRAHLTGRFPAEGDRVRILYGGSVKPSNAKELMSLPNVNGALVGGASLKADDFLAIIRAYA